MAKASVDNLKRLLKSDASPSGRDGRVREKDAGSANSSAICATEDVLTRRPVRSEGRGFVFQQPLSFVTKELAWPTLFEASALWINPPFAPMPSRRF